MIMMMASSSFFRGFFFFFFFTLTIDCSFFLLRKTRSERGEREAKCQEQDAA